MATGATVDDLYRVLHCEEIMYFQPVGQMVFPSAVGDPEPEVSRVDPEPPRTLEPVVALLDGLPIQNHRFLRDRLIVDDPDGWEEGYVVSCRRHGTSMASLITVGDLDANDVPLQRPIYVRPIMRARFDGAQAGFEFVPDDVLFVDVIHRAVRRLFTKEGNQDPVGRRVCLINLSVVDPARAFTRTPCALARLVDWLSHKYNILFVVAAGNYTRGDGDPIHLPFTPSKYRALPKEEQEAALFAALKDRVGQRRLCGPAEAINAITVGAINSDSSTFALEDDLFDVCTNDMPSPENALGLGMRRAVKPDILAPGGRTLLVASPGSPGSESGKARLRLSMAGGVKPPGMRVASPGVPSTVLDRTVYSRGTSNAAAIATRHAALLYEELVSGRALLGGVSVAPRSTPALIKALLVHASRWGKAGERIKEWLTEPDKDNKPEAPRREDIARFLGYGELDWRRMVSCTDQRATVLAWGDIAADRAHTYLLPLPPCLSGRRLWRRLSITLAWFTPISSRNSKYRVADLWFTPPHSKLQLDRDRREVDMQTARRGTLDHEVFEGDRASAYVEGESLAIQVNCRDDAGPIRGRIPYALAATLEVEEGIEVPLYAEVAARIQPQVAVRTGAP